MDRVTEQFLKNIQVFLPAKIIKIYENSIVDVQPLTYADIPLPIINNVPVQHLGVDNARSIKFKCEVGQHGLIFLSQIDFSNYMETGELSKSDTDEVFNLTNAVFVPFVQWRNGGLSFPIADLELTFPEINVNGNLTINGNLNVNGTINCSETINAGVDVIGGGISLKNHTHGGVETGGGSTGAPQ